MIPDINFPAGSWVDLYALSAKPVGTPLLVTNKTASHVVFVWEGATPPANHVTDGFPLESYKTVRISPGSGGCWALSRSGAGLPPGRVLIQEWENDSAE